MEGDTSLPSCVEKNPGTVPEFFDGFVAHTTCCCCLFFRAKSMRRRLIYEPITKARSVKKPSDLLGSDGGRVPPMAYLVTPTGVEPVLPP